MAFRALPAPECGDRGGGHAYALTPGRGRKSRPPAPCPRYLCPSCGEEDLVTPGRGDRAAAAGGERRQPAMVSEAGGDGFSWAVSRVHPGCRKEHNDLGKNNISSS